MIVETFQSTVTITLKEYENLLAIKTAVKKNDNIINFNDMHNRDIIILNNTETVKMLIDNSLKLTEKYNKLHSDFIELKYSKKSNWL